MQLATPFVARSLPDCIAVRAATLRPAEHRRKRRPVSLSLSLYLSPFLARACSNEKVIPRLLTSPTNSPSCQLKVSRDISDLSLVIATAIATPVGVGVGCRLVVVTVAVDIADAAVVEPKLILLVANRRSGKRIRASKIYLNKLIHVSRNIRSVK